MIRETLVCAMIALAPFEATAARKAPGNAGVVGEVKVGDETVPAGGTTQLKFSLTEPKPILVGTKEVPMDVLVFDEILGISVFSPLGDAYGAARYREGSLTVKYASPLGSLGTAVDYPILTVATRIRQDARAGSSATVSLGAGSLFTSTGGQTFSYIPKPGTVTVGGRLFIHNIVPGGGSWPAGTTIRIQGGGFEAGTSVNTKFKTSSARVASATEIELVLARDTKMDGQEISVSNPDRSAVTYFSYQRSTPQGGSNEPGLAGVTPLFPGIELRSATLVTRPAGINNTIVNAIAVENSGAKAATVTLSASTAFQGVFATRQVTLGAGESILGEVSELFGASIPAGTLIRATASEAVHYCAFTADRATGELSPTPMLPY